MTKLPRYEIQGYDQECYRVGDLERRPQEIHDWDEWCKSDDVRALEIKIAQLEEENHRMRLRLG